MTSKPPLPLPIVALVTDRRRAGGVEALVNAVEQAVRNGVNLVQMREKDSPDAAQLELARRLREVTNGRALLFINDSVSIAEAARADGVQLGEQSRSVADARAATARPILIGRSVHDADGARAASEQGADLLVAGAVFDSPTHPGQPPAGVELVRRTVGASAAPVVGIGGITAANAGEVVAAGAAGVAVISGILGDADPARAAARLADAVREAWAARGASATPPALRLTVNGREQEVDAPMTVAAYLETLGFAGRYVAVARNGEVLERDAFGSVTLSDGDRLEIVRPVGGG